MSILMLLAMACEQDPGNGYEVKSPDDESTEAPTPAIEITAPAYGSGFYYGSGDLTWEVTNFALDAGGVGGEDAEGKGHVHVYIDEERVADVAATSFPVSGLPSGPHKLRVALASNDHGEFGVDSTVDITSASPSIRLTGPAEASRYDESTAEVTYTVTDFTLGAPAPGVPAPFATGYVQLTVDGAPFGWSADPGTATLTRLLPGTHALGVELLLADGTPVPIPARDQVSVVVNDTAIGVAIDASAIPATGAWDSPSVPLGITTSNFPLGGSNAYHLYVDGNFDRAGTAEMTSVSNLAPGPHVIEVRLTSGGSENGAYDLVRVDVTEDRPNIVVTNPGSRWRIHPDFTLSLQAENFTLVPAGSGASEDHGHYVVSVDGARLVEGSSESVAIHGAPLGVHTFRVELVGDDGSPLSPPVFNEIDWTVEAVSPDAP